MMHIHLYIYICVLIYTQISYMNLYTHTYIHTCLYPHLHNNTPMLHNTTKQNLRLVK